MRNDVTIDEIREALAKTQGSLTNAAKMLGVRRETLWKWGKEDEEVRLAIRESRKAMLDKCLTAAQALALGVPIMENGRFVGWQEKPDGGMLRYFISCLGRDEGFGENLDITSGGDKVGGLQVEVIDRRELVDKPDEGDVSSVE